MNEGLDGVKVEDQFTSEELNSIIQQANEQADIETAKELQHYRRKIMKEYGLTVAELDQIESDEAWQRKLNAIDRDTPPKTRIELLAV